jgi:hypothetical protein
VRARSLAYNEGSLSNLDKFLDAAITELACPADVRAVARHLLARPERDGSGRSSLNNDGTPMQLCIGVGDDGRSCRLIADPGWTADAPEERYALGRAALAGLIEAKGRALGALCERTLAVTLPVDAAGRAALSTGCLWLAANLAGRGLALYTTARWGEERERWDRAVEWLESVLPDPSWARSLIGPLRPVARPVAHAVEGEDPSHARAKLYYRLCVPVPLARMGVGVLLDPRVAELVGQLFADRPIRADSLVFSLGFALSDGAFTDAKIDVCGHCVPRPAAEWSALLRRWTRRRATPDFGVDGLLLAQSAEVAFLGVGVRTDHGLRTNLYLKPAPG